MDPILIVDDEADNLEALRRLLRNQYDVSIAATPVEGLRLVMTKTFHVIVSDQRMPDMTGVEFLEKVKSVQPASVRILLTGYTDVDSVIGAINRGQIYRYIAKPWDPDDLKITLRQANESFNLQQELKRRNEELLNANHELKQLDAAKARFLSLVSHELNTPLTVLTSFVPLLSENTKRGPEAAKATKAIESATARLSAIVQEIMHYVNIEANPRLQRERVNLLPIVTESLNGIGVLAAEKVLSIDNRLSKSLCLSVDRRRIQLAIKNLLEYVAESAPKTSPIRIDQQEDTESTILVISRMGDPIPETAFEPLEYVSDPMKHQRNLGLRLPLCRSIVEAHGGSIRATKNQMFPAVLEIRFPRHE